MEEERTSKTNVEREDHEMHEWNTSTSSTDPWEKHSEETSLISGRDGDASRVPPVETETSSTGDGTRVNDGALTSQSGFDLLDRNNWIDEDPNYKVKDVSIVRTKGIKRIIAKRIIAKRIIANIFTKEGEFIENERKRHICVC